MMNWSLNLKANNMKKIIFLLLLAVNLFGQKSKFEKTIISTSPYHLDTISFKENVILMSVREGITYYYNNGKDSAILLSLYYVDTKSNSYKVAAINVILYGTKKRISDASLSIRMNKCEQSGIGYGFDDKGGQVCYSLPFLRCDKLDKSTMVMFGFSDKYRNSNAIDFTKSSICGTSSINLIIEDKDVIPFKNRETVNYFSHVDTAIKKLFNTN